MVFSTWGYIANLIPLVGRKLEFSPMIGATYEFFMKS